MLGCCSTTRSISSKNVSGSSFDLPWTSGPGDAQALLQVFLVADQGVELAGDPLDDLLALLGAADGRPELGPVVQVERGDGAGGLGGLHPFDDQRRGRLGERREDAAGMEPAHAAAEDAPPSRNRPA